MSRMQSIHCNNAGLKCSAREFLPSIDVTPCERHQAWIGTEASAIDRAKWARHVKFD